MLRHVGLLVKKVQKLQGYNTLSYLVNIHNMFKLLTPIATSCGPNVDTWVVLLLLAEQG